MYHICLLEINFNDHRVMSLYAIFPCCLSRVIEEIRNRKNLESAFALFIHGLSEMFPTYLVHVVYLCLVVNCSHLSYLVLIEI